MEFDAIIVISHFIQFVFYSIIDSMSKIMHSFFIVLNVSLICMRIVLLNVLHYIYLLSQVFMKE